MFNFYSHLSLSYLFFLEGKFQDARKSKLTGRARKRDDARFCLIRRIVKMKVSFLKLVPHLKHS